ncbi:MAG: hypothetical protein BWY75_00600 [bacterium ADurb.Bin425]|nr:MAG: hypothetical protein BWY75_00600 [bacterium ADurb.Bin425]
MTRSLISHNNFFAFLRCKGQSVSEVYLAYSQGRITPWRCSFFKSICYFQRLILAWAEVLFHHHVSSGGVVGSCFLHAVFAQSFSEGALNIDIDLVAALIFQLFFGGMNIDVDDTGVKFKLEHGKRIATARNKIGINIIEGFQCQRTAHRATVDDGENALSVASKMKGASDQPD